MHNPDLTPTHLIHGRPPAPQPDHGFQAGDTVTIDGVRGTWRIDRIEGAWAGVRRIDQPSGRPDQQNSSGTDTAVWLTRLTHTALDGAA